MQRTCRSSAGFTLVEAVLSIALTSIAGGAILVGVTNSLDATDEVVQQTIGMGLAQQLADEILGTMYAAPGAGAYQTDFSPNAYETGSTHRERYNDIDDFDGLRVQPPKDRWGIPLGTDNGVGGTRNVNFQAPANYLARYRQSVDVYYVSASNFAQKLTGTQTSDFRALDVKIQYNDPVTGWRDVAQVRRVITFLQVP